MNKKKMQNILSVDTVIKLKKTNNLNDISNYTNTMQPVLVTTSVQQSLELCDFNFIFPSQCISYKFNLY